MKKFLYLIPLLIASCASNPVFTPVPKPVVAPVVETPKVLPTPSLSIAGKLNVMKQSMTPAVTLYNVTLAWDASISPSVLGYNVYSGTNSRNYQSVTSLLNVTQGTVSGIDRSITNYFSATAYDSAGESDFSNEAVLPPIPGPSSPTNIVTFSIQILTSSNSVGPYSVFKTLNAFSVTNPVGADFVRSAVSVTRTNL